MKYAFVIVTVLLLAHGCSSYQRAYDREMERLEAEQQAAEARDTAEHAEASRYAAVVYFDVGSAVVGDDGQRELRWFVERIQPYPQAVVLVQGFADTTGSEASNQELSDRRARSVATYLGSQGIAPDRLDIAGYGTASPAAANVTAKGRRNNRRVEVTVR
jgi:outer membrane protein OmpA-like peptidoglycan-associated protein